MTSAVDIQQAWKAILPNFKCMVDDFLHANKVTINDQPMFDEWVADEPTLAVCWSIPSHLAPKRTGRSVSFHLLEVTSSSIVLEIWGAIWEDDFKVGKRFVLVMDVPKSRLDVPSVLTAPIDVCKFLDEVSTGVGDLVKGVETVAKQPFDRGRATHVVPIGTAPLVR